MPISPKAPTFGAGAKIGNIISTYILLHATCVIKCFINPLNMPGKLVGKWP